MTERMLIEYSLTPKVAVIRLVTPQVWEEIAVWRTGASALRGWSWRCFRWGFRVTTPLFGAEVGVWL